MQIEKKNNKNIYSKQRPKSVDMYQINTIDYSVPYVIKYFYFLKEKKQKYLYFLFLFGSPNA